MRLLFLLVSLLSISSWAQEKYGFVHFNSSTTAAEITTFLKEGNALVSGILSNGSTWALLDLNYSELAQLKTKYKTDVTFWTQRIGSPCALRKYQKNTELTFVKYSSHITKFNVQDLPQLFKLHDEHLDKINTTGNILLEGFLDNDDGGVLVMIGTVDEKVISIDPAVVNGILEPEIYLCTIQVQKGCN
ncbi:MAG: hypothetical protein AAF519_09335 [Bacteroidota bacterium]